MLDVEPRFEPAAVTAAVFDIGGVFSYPSHEPVAAALAEVGATVPDDPVAFRRAHHRGVLALSTAVLETGRGPDEGDVGFWQLYDEAYAAHLGIDAQWHERVHVAMRTVWDWVHEPNVAAFHRLATTGLPLAVVSNNDGTAPEQMERYGVCQVGAGPLPSVAAIIDSAIEGVAKPDPAIFTPALEALGADPATVLYVGDTVHADVVGATRAGMQVVQLDPFDDHGHYDHPRVADVDTLVDALT